LELFEIISIWFCCVDRFFSFLAMSASQSLDDVTNSQRSQQSSLFVDFGSDEDDFQPQVCCFLSNLVRSLLASAVARVRLLPAMAAQRSDILSCRMNLTLILLL
jgi:hypothetical protein